MAKSIAKTPDLTGKDAERFMRMHNDLTLTKEREKLLDSFVDTYRKYCK